MIITNEIYDRAVMAEEGLSRMFGSPELTEAISLLREIIAEYHHNAPKEPVNIILEEVEPEAKIA